MPKPILCGMCGMVCGILCGINPLISLTVRHVRHRPYVYVRAHARPRAGAHVRPRAGMAHMTHTAHWRGLRAARHTARHTAQSRAGAFTPPLRCRKKMVVVA